MIRELNHLLYKDKISEDELDKIALFDFYEPITDEEREIMAYLDIVDV